MVETEHPEAGTLRQARQPALFSGTPARNLVGAPRHGEHTRETLLEHGFAAGEITALEAAGAIINDDGSNS